MAKTPQLDLNYLKQVNQEVSYNGIEVISVYKKARVEKEASNN